jgi:polyphosphate glucokinase
MFVNGRLVPNLELGHIYMRNRKRDAEDYASDRIRQENALDWRTWGERLNEYFRYIEALFSPQLIIIGGGVSSKHKRFLKYIDIQAKIVPAELLNQAGIVGAALAAVQT